MANKKAKSLKRALFTGAVSMVLCMSMFVGTTFAWFTDSVTSGKNQIVAGNLDVDLSYWTDTNADGVKDNWVSVQGKSDVFDPNAYWEPGHTEVVYLQIENNGSLAVKYRFTLDIFGETVGKTVGGDEIRLSDYMQFGFVEDVEVGDLDNRAAAIAAVETEWTLKTVGAYVDENGNKVSGHYHNEGVLSSPVDAENKVIPMLPKETKTFAVVLWIPTSVGNEANSNGVDVPSVDLGVTLVATQVANEEDSFGPDYDGDASLPLTGTGTTTVDPTTNYSAYEVVIRSSLGGKIATALVPAGAIAEGAEELVMTVDETSVNENITVGEGEAARTFEINIEGLKENNDVPVTISLRVGPGLTSYTVYHYDEEIASENVQYDDEYIIFETTSFSPFTVLYSTTPVDPGSPDAKPKAVVTNVPEYENVDIEWGKYGAWSPTAGLDSQLEAAYKFEIDEQSLAQVESSYYRDWYCDFYVKLDKDLGANQIFLGGNYGSFGWVGFHNGDLTLEAGTEIPLLGSVTTNPWTYEMVAEYVGTFICGVGDVDDALADATFTVMLRLTNPDDETDFFNVETINYTFTASANA